MNRILTYFYSICLKFFETKCQKNEVKWVDALRPLAFFCKRDIVFVGQVLVISQIEGEKMNMFLKNSRIRLRPVEEKDLQTLYSWRNEFDFLSLFSPHRNIINYEKFLSEHKRNTDKSRHVQLISESVKSNTIIGITYTYDISLTDGYVFLGGYIPSEFCGKGYGAIGMAMVIAYLFKFFPLNKIYFEVFEYNKPSISMLKNFGCTEEGRFKRHRFYDGKHHDVLRFALYREELGRASSLLLKLKQS